LTVGLLADRPDLAQFPEAVAAWATAEAQAALLRRHLAEVGTVDDFATWDRHDDYFGGGGHYQWARASVAR